MRCSLFANPEKGKIYYHEWYIKNRKRISIYQKQWRKTHREQNRLYSNRANAKRKIRILSHYSTTIIPSCVCCNETRIEFLSIDHINGGGNKQRIALKKAGQDFYKWIEKNNYPNGFRVLCHNCNQAIGHFGHCPHMGFSYLKSLGIEGVSID